MKKTKPTVQKIITEQRTVKTQHQVPLTAELLREALKSLVPNLPDDARLNLCPNMRIDSYETVDLLDMFSYNGLMLTIVWDTESTSTFSFDATEPTEPVLR